MTTPRAQGSSRVKGRPQEWGCHINGDTLDNGQANLWACTIAQNQGNTQGRGESDRHKGVSWYDRHEKCRGAVRANGQFVWVGYFVDETEAALAYNLEALEAARRVCRAE